MSVKFVDASRRDQNTFYFINIIRVFGARNETIEVLLIWRELSLFKSLEIPYFFAAFNFGIRSRSFVVGVFAFLGACTM